MDEIIERRDLPFLSSVVFLRFRPVVVVREREEEERRALCYKKKRWFVVVVVNSIYYVRVNHRGGCDPGGVRRETDRPNVEEAGFLLRERKNASSSSSNVSRGAVRSKISKKELDDARKLWAVVVKVCRRRESRGEGDDDRWEHENSLAGGHEQRLQRVPDALAVGKSELVSSRVFQKCQVRPHDPVRFVQRALGIVSNKKWQNWMRERRVRAQSVPFIPRHAS